MFYIRCILIYTRHGKMHVDMAECVSHLHRTMGFAGWTSQLQLCREPPNWCRLYNPFLDTAKYVVRYSQIYIIAWDLPVEIGRAFVHHCFSQILNIFKKNLRYNSHSWRAMKQNPSPHAVDRALPLGQRLKTAKMPRHMRWHWHLYLETGQAGQIDAFRLAVKNNGTFPNKIAGLIHVFVPLW